MRVSSLGNEIPKSRLSSQSNLEELEVDGALAGIVDKIILKESEIFLVGLSGRGMKNGDRVQCGKFSSFTEEIIDVRKVKFRSSKEKVWNVVQSFSRRPSALK